MATTIWIQVVGFDDAERHSFNTLFRVSRDSPTNYALWSSDFAAAPDLALIDLDSYEGGLMIGSPGLNPHLKVIGVGSGNSLPMWLNLQRPVDWAALLHALDRLFAAQPGLQVQQGSQETAAKPVPPGVKVALLVGLERQEGLYLRSRLSLAGVKEVDEAASVAQVSAMLFLRPYALVVLSLEIGDADPWALVQSLNEMPSPMRSIIVVTRTPSWRAMERAEQLGCRGLLEIPFVPQQVMALLRHV